MKLRSLKRAGRYLALTLALFGLVALALDATPQVVCDETESEAESQVEALVLAEALPAIAPFTHAPDLERACAHSIREAEELVTRNVTFRIDRPPPA